MASATIKFCLVLILALIASSRAELRELRETSMTIYFQDQFGGPNATVIQITPENGEGHLSFAKFGAISCTDDLMTEEFDTNSSMVARAQCVYITSDLDGSTTQVLISIVFNNAEYKGSSLEVQAASAQFEKVREVAVVGGTGKFQFAHDISPFE